MVVMGMDRADFQRVDAMSIGDPSLEPGFNLANYMESVERSVLSRALAMCDGDRSAAGKLLGVERNTLRYKLNKYDLLES